MIAENQLEKLVVSWFQDTGYRYLEGKDIAPESKDPYRQSFQEVLLEKELFTAIRNLNPNVPHGKLEEVIKELKNPKAAAVAYQNQAFHKQLLQGIEVEYEVKGEMKKDKVFLVDFQRPANNRFLVVDQFAVAGTKWTRRPDLVVFLNGLPIAVLELKSPGHDESDIWDAFNQLQTYKDDIPDLFIYNQALVVSDGINARLGSLTANRERFMPWRTIEDQDDRPLLKYQLEAIVKGFFKPELLLDYLHYFVLFEKEEQLIKKIAGYHQFHAVREAVKVTLIAADIQETNLAAEPRANYGKRVERGSKKAGVIWHTQGSGKSISMVCYTGKLVQQGEMKNPTVVVVTDRTDLDGQLFATFSHAADLLRETPVQAQSREELREMLDTRNSGGIIFTTIQKFALLNGEENHPMLCNRDNVVVISDEAHRSQYGDKAKLDTKTGVYKYGYSKHLRDALPNATFIGFTGTPISQGDKDTRAVFGDEISIYDIQDAVDDGATVPIYYESRLARLDINRTEIDALSDEVEDIIESEEDLALRESTKSKWTTLEKLVGAAPRLKQVAEDLVNHFEGRLELTDGKAMILCMSREICVNLYNAITAIKPEWHSEDKDQGAIKVVMTGSAADKELLQPHIHSKGTRKVFERRFKKAEDPLKLVIVRDMWLTGFDAPACHTMYVDKPMRGHNLMQAIARVNRVFKDKPGGLVVDYLGIANELREALKTYTDARGKGAPTLKTAEAFEILLKNLQVVRDMMHGFNYSDYKSRPMELLLPAANHILEKREKGKRRFLDLMAAVNKAYSLCSTLDKAQELKLEIAFFNAIKTAFLKSMNVDQKRLKADRDSLLKRILDNAVVAEGVEDVLKLAGLEKPDIGILSPEFLEEVSQIPQKNLAVELLEKLLRNEIRSRTKGNVVQEKRYGERLQEAIRKYNNRAIETTEVIKVLLELHEDFLQAMKREENLGLSPDEIRFYTALEKNNTGEKALKDENLKQIAVELTKRLRQSTTVDWQVRESVKAKIRNMVRRLLRRYGYPPEFSQDAIKLVLDQATALGDMWTEDDTLSNPPQVFISHTSSDSDMVKALQHALEHQIEFIWAYSEQMTSDALLPQEVMGAIRSAKHFAVLVSKNSLNSDWVSRQVSVAQETQKLSDNYKIIPLVMSDVQMAKLEPLFSNEVPRCISLKASPTEVQDAIPELFKAIGQPSPYNWKQMHVKDQIRLTGREREIMPLLVLGKSSKAIGEELGMAISTVNTLRHNLIMKFDAKNSVEMMIKAKEQGWMEPATETTPQKDELIKIEPFINVQLATSDYGQITWKATNGNEVTFGIITDAFFEKSSSYIIYNWYTTDCGNFPNDIPKLHIEIIEDANGSDTLHISKPITVTMDVIHEHVSVEVIVHEGGEILGSTVYQEDPVEVMR